MEYIRSALKKTWLQVKGPLVAQLEERLSLIELSMLQLEKRVGKTPFFIQVGANDGSMADPFILISKRWDGLMIEPQKQVFERLVAARSQVGKQFANVAVSDKEGELSFYHIDLPGDRSTGLASFEREVVVKHLENGFVDGIARELGIVLPNERRELIKETKVRMCPLSKLIQEFSIEEVDALFVDVEGHEYNVLRSFPWSATRPKLIVYEVIHLTPEAYASCVSLLQAQGYALVKDGMDMLAIATEANLLNRSTTRQEEQ